MTEYIGSKVTVQCSSYGVVTGEVSDVSDEKITLLDVTVKGFPNVHCDVLELMAADILGLELVHDQEPPPSTSDSAVAATVASPTTRCAYVCPTTPVRPMRPMRSMKGDEGPPRQSSVSAPAPPNFSVKSQEAPQNNKVAVSQPQQSQTQSVQPKNTTVQHRSSRVDSNTQSTAKGQSRRRAFSASFDGMSQHVAARTAEAAERANNGGGQRRPSRPNRETWYEMNVSDMQEEFDFEANLQKFNKMEFYQRVDAQNQRQGASPRTVRGRKGPEAASSGQKKTSKGGKDSCFDMDVSQMHEEFDFEGNLAQFNKSAFYKEVDQRRQRSDRQKSSPETVQRRPDVVPEPKYRHDENVLASTLQPVRQPVSLPPLPPLLASDRPRVFACADGVQLPACPPGLRRLAFKAAERMGHSWALVAELFGRAVCELLLDQVGARTRLRPGNEHQLPHLVVVAGPHLQGSLGVAVARHLALRRCLVSLVLPRVVVGCLEPPAAMRQQIDLFASLTGLEPLADLGEVSASAVDFVVSAFESHEPDVNDFLSRQPWAKRVVAYLNASRPPCLVVDPPPGKSAISPRLMVGLGLPLPVEVPEGSAVHYLCDVGLSPAVFQQVGISYLSPFSYRSILLLSDGEDGSERSSDSTR